MRSKLGTILLGACLLIMAGMASATTAPTVATCPTAAANTVFVSPAWLPCSVTVAYQTPTQGQIVARLNPGTGASWVSSFALLPTDQVWALTAAAPTGAWTKVSTLTFGSAIPPNPPGYTTTAQLSWTAPTANVDGSTPANVSGYVVYSGASPTALAVLASVGATVLGYQATIGIGSTYFAVETYNANAPPPGDSVMSNVVSKTVKAPTTSIPNPPALSP